MCNVVLSVRQILFRRDDQKVVEEVEVDADERQPQGAGAHHGQVLQASLVHKKTPACDQRNRLDERRRRPSVRAHCCSLDECIEPGATFKKSIITLTLPKSSSISRQISSSICFIFRTPLSHSVTTWCHNVAAVEGGGKESSEMLFKNCIQISEWVSEWRKNEIKYKADENGK